MIKKMILLVVLYCTILSSFSQKNGEQLFNDSFLHEIRFENADTNIFISTKDYQRLLMKVDGEIVDSVGFKRKGNISAYYNPNKFGIKIKTNKYVSGKKHDGIKEFTLHINYQDPTMMREKLSYDICSDMGLFSLRTAFAKVYINEKYWGLYTLVEGKDEMYKQVFDHRDMDAIESLDFGGMCYISDNPADYDIETNGDNPTYQLENGDGTTAWPRFSLMIDKANNTADNQYLDTVPKYLNIEDFLKYQAFNVYLMNMDSYIGFMGNQIYMYDTVANLWQIMPWDFNASFGLWNTNNYSPTSYPMIPGSIENGCIASKMNNIPILKTYYLDAMCQLNNIIGDTTVYFSKIDEFKNQIKQAVYEDTRKHITNTDFDNGVDYGYHSLFGENQPALKTLITDRLAIVKQGLIHENYSCQSTGINDFDSPKSLKVFPNPANHYIIIEVDQNQQKIVEVSIVNTLGQVVLYHNSNSSRIDISKLKPGIYLVVAHHDTAKSIGKFIKE